MGSRQKKQRGGARPGAGRKPILEDAVRFLIYLDGPIETQLRAFARRDGVSASVYVRGVLTRHVRSRKRRER